ncbi:MAG: transcription termination factor Rho [Planctomycetes bacterium]|nr:transcription termination factor Rho [Planctomycetota bacterium]
MNSTHQRINHKNHRINARAHRAPRDGWQLCEMADRAKCHPPTTAGSGKASHGAIHAVRQTATATAVTGVLELHTDGHGFLRNQASGYRPSPSDVLVPATLVERFGLRPGVFARGLAEHSGDGESPWLCQLDEIEGVPADEYRQTPRFASLTPVHPRSRLRLETGREPLSTRVIDLFVPVGKGQRGLIVAPPRSGKTMLLKEIGQAVTRNHPEVTLLMLLVDERPEEITEMRRQVAGEIVASSLDQDVESHVRVSQLVVERCKRLAERGEDVLLLIDSLTRMARAFNKSVHRSRRTLTGGLDIKALDVPKKLFASARAFEEGGSLTILGTALVETGSRMDDLIFEEFKGTGNLELVLDRRLAERRIWPALDLVKSGTRRDEKLLDGTALEAVIHCRRTINPRDPAEAMRDLSARLNRHQSNREFIDWVNHQKGRATDR